MSESNSDLGEYSKFVKPNWNEEELRNFGVVASFMQALKTGAVDRLISEYGDHPYVQHNPSMETGVQGVLKELQRIGENAPDFFVDTKHAYVDGQFVIFQAHFTAVKDHRGDDSQGLNAIDIWKVVDGKIVEHWDSIQPLGGAPAKNANGIF